MAISRRFPVLFELAFPVGAYLVSEVTPVVDFEKSTREHKVQQVDSDTGKLLWQVDVLDADPEAKRSAKTVAVKIPANVQPVPPGNDGSSPFTAVVFEGLTALPWIEQVSEEYSKISWSYRAEDMAAPRGKPAPVETSGDKPSSPSSKSAA